MVKDWREELKRQCEIRNLPFKGVSYLVDEVLQAERDEIMAGIEKLKVLTQEATGAFKWDETFDECISLIRNRNKGV